MEILGALEEKIKHLVTLVKELRAHKERLEVDNLAFKERVERLEQALTKKDEDANKEWDKEKASARKAVDELISDIDSLIESGSRQ
jgi:outer membrane murein-binding lipoprotein Lpp